LEKPEKNVFLLLVAKNQILLQKPFCVRAGQLFAKWLIETYRLNQNFGKLIFENGHFPKFYQFS